MQLKEKVIDVLKQCFDPEIPIDLWSLGLIYEINVSKKNKSQSDIDIVMSLTTPGCSMGQQMADDIKSKVSSIKEVENVNVAVTFEPAWKPEMMSEEARKKLGFDGPVLKQNQPKIETEWE